MVEIAIVGGGYAGLAALGSLRTLLPRARITLIDPAACHVERARLQRLLAGERIAWPFEEILPRDVRWLRARALEVEPTRVRTTGGDVRADFVLVATGAAPRRPVKGMKVVSGVPSIRSLGRLRGTVRIVGAGLTGIELAAALATAGRKVELYERKPGLLPDQPPEVRRAVSAALSRLGVLVRYRTSEIPDGRNVVAAAGVIPASPSLAPGVRVIGDADPGNAWRCARIARAQGLSAAAEIARACGVRTAAAAAAPLGQLIDLGAAGTVGWLDHRGQRIPITGRAASLAAAAIAARHRAFLWTLPRL